MEADLNAEDANEFDLSFHIFRFLILGPPVNRTTPDRVAVLNLRGCLSVANRTRFNLSSSVAPIGSENQNVRYLCPITRRSRTS